MNTIFFKRSILNYGNSILIMNYKISAQDLVNKVKKYLQKNDLNQMFFTQKDLHSHLH